MGLTVNYPVPRAQGFKRQILNFYYLQFSPASRTQGFLDNL